MRTTDFSKAPRLARAEAMVVVETGGSRDARQEARAAAKAHAGFCWSTTFRAKDPHGRVVLGVIAYFSSGAEAEDFAATSTPGQRTRLFHAERQGYSNGVWRAEGNVMAHIERFTPVSLETQRRSEPPRVDAPSPRTRLRTRRRASRGETQSGSPVSAGAMFVGATRYRGPHSWIVLSRDWYPMVAKMRRMSGYVWHTVYWEPPFTLGTLAFFATRDDLLAFARMPEHRRLMQWITRGTRYGTGGYIRLHLADSAADPGAAAEAGPGR
jgi:hypothetical protein